MNYYHTGVEFNLNGLLGEYDDATTTLFCLDAKNLIQIMIQYVEYHAASIKYLAIIT